MVSGVTVEVWRMEQIERPDNIPMPGNPLGVRLCGRCPDNLFVLGVVAALCVTGLGWFGLTLVVEPTVPLGAGDIP